MDLWLVVVAVSALTTRCVTTPTLRSSITTLHLIVTTEATSTAWHRTVTLRCHTSAVGSSIATIATTCWAWTTHRRLIWRIAGHRASRMRTTLVCHRLWTTILWKTVRWGCLAVTGCLGLLRRVAVEMARRRTVFAPLRKSQSA